MSIDKRAINEDRAAHIVRVCSDPREFQKVFLESLTPFSPKFPDWRKKIPKGCIEVVDERIEEDGRVAESGLRQRFAKPSCP